MHAEAVKFGGIPSKLGLIHDDRRTISCAECDASYQLHYDREAETKFTVCSILAAEIITARHPDHEQRIVLEPPQQVAEKALKKEGVLSTRLSLENMEKKRPHII
jgi:hypothetical protein